MARARFQEGSLAKIGDKWVARYRVYDANGKATNKKETIGLISKMGKREANQKKQEIVARGTGQLPQSVSTADRSEMTFQSFYDDRFLPLKVDWSAPYRKTFLFNVKHYIMPKFGSLRLGAIDKVMIQTFLNNLAATYSKSTVRHVRGKLVEILGEATEQEFLTRNPAKKTTIPSVARKPHQPIITAEQFLSLLRKITDGRDKALFYVGTFCAMRTSEIFGLSWRQLHHDERAFESYFIVDQVAYEGVLYKDQTKTEDSKAKVPIGEETLRVLLQWKKESPDTSPDSLIFGSTNKNGRSKKGAPMWSGQWLQKRLQPIAEAVGITETMNFRLTRRSWSSISQNQGQDVATVQSVMRHSTAATTLSGSYTQPVPESAKRAVNDYEELIFAAKPATPKRAKLQRVK